MKNIIQIMYEYKTHIVEVKKTDHETCVIFVDDKKLFELNLSDVDLAMEIAESHIDVLSFFTSD